MAKILVYFLKTSTIILSKYNLVLLTDIFILYFIQYNQPYQFAYSYTMKTSLQFINSITIFLQRQRTIITKDGFAALSYWVYFVFTICTTVFLLTLICIYKYIKLVYNFPTYYSVISCKNHNIHLIVTNVSQRFIT